jgi:hypothetical protein
MNLCFYSRIDSRSNFIFALYCGREIWRHIAKLFALRQDFRIRAAFLIE